MTRGCADALAGYLTLIEKSIYEGCLSNGEICIKKYSATELKSVGIVDAETILQRLKTRIITMSKHLKMAEAFVQDVESGDIK